MAGVHKTVNRPMVTIKGRFFVLCTGAGAPKAPLVKGALGAVQNRTQRTAPDGV